MTSSLFFTNWATIISLLGNKLDILIRNKAQYKIDGENLIYLMSKIPILQVMMFKRNYFLKKTTLSCKNYGHRQCNHQYCTIKFRNRNVNKQIGFVFQNRLFLVLLDLRSNSGQTLPNTITNHYREIISERCLW